MSDARNLRRDDTAGTPLPAGVLLARGRARPLGRSVARVAARLATGGNLAALLLPIALFVLPGLQAADAASHTLLLAGSVAGPAIVTVGERGSIFRSMNDGAAWTAAKSPTHATLTGISFADSARGWAVGHDATILATSDGGHTWSKQWQGANLTDSFLDLLALDQTHVIAIGAYGLYVTSVDGGHTWKQRKIIADDYHLNRISRDTAGNLYIAGEHGTILRSRNRGASWVAIPTTYDGSFYGVLPLRSGALLAYGLRGRIFRSEDDGEHWNPVANAETELIATGVETSPGQVVLAGQLRALLVSTDDGRTFTRPDLGMLAGIAELLPLARGSLLSLGEAGAQRIDLRSPASDVSRK